MLQKVPVGKNPQLFVEQFGLLWAYAPQVFDAGVKNGGQVQRSCVPQDTPAGE